MTRTTVLHRFFSNGVTTLVVLILLVVLTPSVSGEEPGTNLADTLSPTEREWLNNNQVIKLGIDRAFPPFGFISEKGDYEGFAAEYMQLIEKKLGIQFQVFKDASWGETIQLAKSGEIDMIAGLVNTEERQEYLHFTPAYIKTPTVIFNDGLTNGYIGSLEKLKHKTVAIEAGSFASEKLSANFPDIKLIPVKNTALALSMVSSGQAEAYVGNAAAASHLIKKMGFHSLFYAGSTPYSSNHSIGIVKDNPVLLSIMNKALQSIDEQTKERMVDKWFGMQIYPHIRLNTALGFLALALAALTFSGLWIYSLHRTRQTLRISEKRIRHQANIDSLTGLINRRYTYELLSKDTEQTDTNNNQFSLLFLDLDAFKDVNDSLGHSIGDKLLKRVAERLLNCVRIEDVVGRLGGDEFIIILRDTRTRKDIIRVARKVCESLSREFVIQGNSIHVSTSIGITLFPKDASSAEELLINADQAMYACKNSNGNGYAFFNESMRDEMIQRNEILRDLKQAIQKQQLALYYQPILDLHTGEIVKAEALIRWKHPERGMITPDIFIKLAEESGYIHEIGEWIFQEATAQLATWRRKYMSSFQVSINTSPLQYREGGIDVDAWCEKLSRLKLDGSALIVEITESLLMETGAGVQKKLLRLRKAGIEVAIDDFGTGYSSLSYLKKFDTDYLKIDQSFVSHQTAESEDFALCEAITVMAHKLGCYVVAEGIETMEQADLLRNAGCDFGQGYLFAKPMPAHELAERLATEASRRDDANSTSLTQKKAVPTDTTFS